MVLMQTCRISSRREQYDVALSAERFQAIALAEAIAWIKNGQVQFIRIELVSQPFRRILGDGDLDTGAVLLETCEEAR